MTMLMRIAAVLGLMAVSIAASADVYKWVDSQGRVYYSDRPDNVDSAERLAVVSRRTNPEQVTQRNEADRTQRQATETQSAQQKRDQAAAQAVNKDVSKTRDEQCKQAKEQYRVAIESQKLYRIGKDGERYYLTSAEIDEARLNARRAMDQVCGSTN
jgi:hypothetical protein